MPKKLTKIKSKDYLMSSTFFEYGKGNRFEIKTWMVATEGYADYFRSDVVKLGHVRSMFARADHAESIALAVRWIIASVKYREIENEAVVTLEIGADNKFVALIDIAGDHVGNTGQYEYPDQAMNEAWDAVRKAVGSHA